MTCSSRWSTERLATARALVVSGSLPPGLAAELPSRLAGLAREAGVPVLLDVDDAALVAAVDGGGAVLAPNTDELARLLGEPVGVDPAAAVHRLARRTGAAVVLTRGERGVLAVDGDRCWTASLPAVRGNPTGAGDATAAGIARGLARGDAWPDVLRHAVALGAAAVLTPAAGEIDRDAYESFVPRVVVDGADLLATDR